MCIAARLEFLRMYSSASLGCQGLLLLSGLFVTIFDIGISTMKFYVTTIHIADNKYVIYGF